MPTEPTSSSGFRPNRSTNAIAMSVVTMLITPVIELMRIESCSVKPTECQSAVL